MFNGMKDLLGMRQLSAKQINEILDYSKTLKYCVSQKIKKMSHLQGRNVVTLFYENSTRTRLSFEAATKYMGGYCCNVEVGSSSVQKGENLIDTVKTIDAMGTDAIVIRHRCSGVAELVAKNVNATVINAGDGMNEHPTQSLLDLFTIKEYKGGFDGLKVAIIGDIYHSRVARSDIWALTKLGAEVSVGAPPTLLPKDLEKTGAKVYESVQEAIVDADVVMGLRMQTERQKSGFVPSVGEYSKFYGIDKKRLSLAKKDAILMHPGPVNRSVELAPEVIDSPQSVITEQVRNGVVVRMGVLSLFTRSDS